MRKSVKRFALLLVLAAAGPQAACPAQRAPVAAAAADRDAAGRAFLAEWFVQAARENLAPEVSAASLRQSAALIEAGARLNPAEPRFPRLLADAMEPLHDIPGQIAALNAYRKPPPDDRALQA